MFSLRWKNGNGGGVRKLTWVWCSSWDFSGTWESQQQELPSGYRYCQQIPPLSARDINEDLNEGKAHKLYLGNFQLYPATLKAEFL